MRMTPHPKASGVNLIVTGHRIVIHRPVIGRMNSFKCKIIAFNIKIIRHQPVDRNGRCRVQPNRQLINIPQTAAWRIIDGIDE